MIKTSINKPDTKQSVLLKGDISGIQEFIFSVSSKKAARSLKARSYFIQQISKWTLQRILDNFPGSNKIYDGGGNFYVDLHNYSEEKIISIQNEANEQLSKTGIYVLLETVKYENQDAFVTAWKDVNVKINRQKIKKLQTSKENLFQPYFYEKEKEYISLDIIEHDSYFDKSFFGNNLKLLFENEKDKLTSGKPNDLFKNIPVWESTFYAESKDEFKEFMEQNPDEKIKKNNVVSFVYLAEFARKRTGTASLGILKMDVDNLHLLFSDFGTSEIAQKVSGKYNNFFNTIIFELINEYESANKIKVKEQYNLLKNNIYPVFSGGDDCFFVGAWDYMLIFTQLVQKKFIEFRNNEINTIKGFEDKKNTLSASLSLVDAHFPVTRFAEIAEERLSEAKQYPYLNKKGKTPKKNAINFMGEVITWDEFDKITQLIQTLQRIIEKESTARNLLYRITDSAKDFDILQNKALTGTIKFPEIWRLFYTVKRNIKSKELQTILHDKILIVYEKSLLDAYQKKMTTNPVIFPLAARWAEFLTRNK